MLVHLDRDEVAAFPASAITLRGKELQADDPAAAARALLARETVKVIPVLDGARYVGAVDSNVLACAAAENVPVGHLATSLLPVAAATAPTREALQALDADGGSRLVVLDEDGATYVGLVCLRGDRRRLCLDSGRLGL